MADLSTEAGGGPAVPELFPRAIPTRNTLPPRLKEKRCKSDQLRRAARKALEYSNTIRWHEGDRSMVEPTEALMEVYCASEVEKVMSLLVRSRKAVMHKVALEGGRSRIELTDLGRQFIDLVGPHGGFGSIVAEFPNHAFHPLIELFWKHTVALMWRMPLRLSQDAEVIQQCVDGIRQEASTVAFRKRREKHGKVVRQNTESLLNYIDELFGRWGKLLVIRLDLGYRKAAGISAELAQAHREQLQSYLRTKKFPAVFRGYAWSLESGRSTGPHLHMLLFLDGGQSRQDVMLAKLIGEHWNGVITSGRGRYHNCNADYHPRRGVGLIDHKNAELLKNLKEIVAPYLTKADYYIRTLVEGGRTFGHGQVPAAPARTGRPRNNVQRAA